MGRASNLTAHIDTGNASYPDDGCDLVPKCLTCPPPACRYDLPPKRAGMLVREMTVLALLRRGASAEEIAAAMGISRRTVFRLKSGATRTLDRYGPEGVASLTAARGVSR